MIREGKAGSQPWLQLPTNLFVDWAKLYGLELNNVTVGPSDTDSIERGNGIFAQTDIVAEQQMPLAAIPLSLTLSKEQLREQARMDPKLNELLVKCGDFVDVSGIRKPNCSLSHN
jgi:hypothetical protein